MQLEDDSKSITAKHRIRLLHRDGPFPVKPGNSGDSPASKEERRRRMHVESMMRQ